MASIKSMSVFLAAVSILMYAYCVGADVELRVEKGRLTIVAALKDTQFLPLYKFLSHHARQFDPRYAGSLRTDGNPNDKNQNLHITLASTDLGELNEKACIYALHKIARHFKREIHVNFKPAEIKLDKWRHVILPLKNDAGYNSLLQLQKIIHAWLLKKHASGIHTPKPNHVTIGFASKLSASKYHRVIGFGRITHARVYHWIGSGEQKFPPREEFYPKDEVQIYS